jgi:hypothetical protein
LIEKRRHKKKGKQRSTGKGKAPRGPFFVKDPLSDLPREKVIPGLIELGKASKARFHDSLNKTLAVLQSAEPL